MIPLMGCSAHGGKLIVLDDESVVEDQGSAYTPYLVSTDVDAGAGGFARLRRFVMALDHNGAVTATITPYKDGQESGPAIERVLAIGANPMVDAPMAVGANRFAVKIVLSDFDAAAEIGKAEMHVIPRRSKR